MSRIVFNTAYEKFLQNEERNRPDYYVRVKRRTWRTLWLVKRTYREPRWNPINIALAVPPPPKPKVDKPPGIEMRGI